MSGQIHQRSFLLPKLSLPMQKFLTTSTVERKNTTHYNRRVSNYMHKNCVCCLLNRSNWSEIHRDCQGQTFFAWKNSFFANMNLWEKFSNVPTTIKKNILKYSKISAICYTVVLSWYSGATAAQTVLKLTDDILFDTCRVAVFELGTPHNTTDVCIQIFLVF